MDSQMASLWPRRAGVWGAGGGAGIWLEKEIHARAPESLLLPLTLGGRGDWGDVGIGVIRLGPREA